MLPFDDGWMPRDEAEVISAHSNPNSKYTNTKVD
jgi:hypothetical protein